MVTLPAAEVPVAWAPAAPPKPPAEANTVPKPPRPPIAELETLTFPAELQVAQAFADPPEPAEPLPKVLERLFAGPAF